MKRGLWHYIKAAFNARPIGMFVPPNWVGLAAFGMLGLLNPGLWAIGAGLELAYLVGVGTSKRFQRIIDAKSELDERGRWQERLADIIAELSPEERSRYAYLSQRCQAIIEHQESTGHSASDLDLQREGLGRLLWIYLRLLRTRQAILRVLRESIDLERTGEPIDRRIIRLQREKDRARDDDNLRKSLEGQIDILEQRLAKRDETRRKLAFIDSELARIEQQVELIREQAVIATEPHTVSDRIDAISATLGETQQWIRDQQQVVGQLDDLLDEPPPVLGAPQRVSQ